MEKLGVEKETLLADLREEYNQLKAQSTELVKTGAPVPPSVSVRLAAVIHNIEELQRGAS